MAITKTAQTIYASASLAAATSVNGTEMNESATNGGIIVCGKVTNGTTGPAKATTMSVYIGEATGKKRLFQILTAGLGASQVVDLVCIVPPAAMFVNVTFNNPDPNQAVTVECYGQEFTSTS